MTEPEQLNVSTFNRRFIAWIERHSRLAIGLGLVLVLLMAPGLTRIQTDFTHAGFFSSDDPQLLKFEEFERRFGNDDTVVILVHSPSGVYDRATVDLVARLTEAMWHVPEVVRVESIANYDWLHGREGEIVVEPFLPAGISSGLLEERRRLNEEEDILPRYLVSPDGETTLVAGRIQPAIERPPDSAAITQGLRQVVASAEVTDEALHLGGTPIVTYAFEEITIADLARLVPVIVVLMTGFLYLILRRAVIVFLPFVTVSASLICAFGMAGWVGLVQVPLSTAIPSILIAVGICDTLHVLIGFVRMRDAGLAQADAARHSLQRNLLPTFLTCLTTAVGFFSFIGAPLEPLAMLGIVTGVGTAVTWLFAFVVSGACLFLIPIPARAPMNVRPLAGWVAPRLVALVSARPLIVLVASASCSLFCLWYASGIEVSTDPIKYFRTDVPVRQAHHALEEQMGTSRSIELIVEAGTRGGALEPEFLQRVDALEQTMKADSGVTAVVSLIDLLKEMNQALDGGAPAAYKLPESAPDVAQQLLLYAFALPPDSDLSNRITVEEDALRVTLLGNHDDSTEAVALVDRAIARGAELGLDVTATGKYFLYQETSDYVVRSLLGSITTATLGIGLIMALMLRSVWLGLIAMVPNVIPLFVAGALLRFLNLPLDLGTAMVASVALGICIDDTSQVLANFARIRRDGHEPLPALGQVMEHSLPALLSTNGILIASFASFVIATYVPNMLFGLLTSFVFVVALVSDLVMTPALLLLSRVQKRDGRVVEAAS